MRTHMARPRSHMARPCVHGRIIKKRRGTSQRAHFQGKVNELHLARPPLAIEGNQRVLNCALHGGLIRRRIAYPIPKNSFRRSCHGVVILPSIHPPCTCSATKALLIPAVGQASGCSYAGLRLWVTRLSFFLRTLSGRIFLKNIGQFKSQSTILCCSSYHSHVNVAC